MQRRALELQAPVWAELDEEPLVPDVADRLGEIAVPTLVLVGEEDVEDIHAVAARLAAEIPRSPFGDDRRHRPRPAASSGRRTSTRSCSTSSPTYSTTELGRARPPGRSAARRSESSVAVDHPVSSAELVRPWRTATMVATAVAGLELVLLVVAGIVLLGKSMAPDVHAAPRPGGRGEGGGRAPGSGGEADGRSTGSSTPSPARRRACSC